jgi:hypothetical protein
MRYIGLLGHDHWDGVATGNHESASVKGFASHAARFSDFFGDVDEDNLDYFSLARIGVFSRVPVPIPVNVEV